jgi:uncharacterized protein (TIGR03437 family)
VRVLVAHMPSRIYFVSDKQINFLVPAALRPGEVEVQVTRDGTAGPAVRVTLAEAAPALFPVATHADGSVINTAAPAHPGEVVVLYGTGFGRTEPDAVDSQLPSVASALRRASDFLVQLNGVALERAAVMYTGLTPGYAGLYQVNVRLPDRAGGGVELRVGFAENLSAPLKVAAE